MMQMTPKPYAFCCAEGGGRVEHCDCVNKNHGTALFPASAEVETVEHTRRVVCPRCYEQCGWCSDPRHMHGKFNLPGTKKKCTIPGMEPEGENCPMCDGAQVVVATTTYTKVQLTDQPNSGE